MSLGLIVALFASASWAQQDPVTDGEREAAKAVPTDEAPIRQPPRTVDANGKPIPVPTENLVLADPATKLYMPCRGPNDLKPDDSKSVKLNPKAAVLSEEAAKQHGYKPSPHKVDCPKP